MAQTDVDAVNTTTTVSVHSESSDGNKYWDVQSATDESIETIATTPPHTDESNNKTNTGSAAAPRRKRGLTITQDKVDKEKEATTSSEKGEEDIDWDFWSRVISDFDNVVKNERPTLSVQIERGVPPSLRGMIWQLLTRSKDPNLEQQYLELINQESVYEKAITRDLSRTFPNNDYFQSKAGQEALFNVVKAYSLYDSDVGYCQGISFIAGPLLLNMPEEEAFCVLVQLMQKYTLRGHFAHQLDLLHQRLYQFDGLLYDFLPHVHRHFETQGIRSNMYASQWFMTLFAYKFPLDVVFRIYDIILAEGIEALYTFALALVQKNQSVILSLEFDALVNYLKSDILTVYDNDTTHLIRDAYKFKIPPKRFARLAKEYRLEAARVQNEAQIIENLKKQKKSLSETIRNLETNLKDINKEYALVANELIQSKMEVARIHDENDALRQQSQDLKRALETLPAEIEARVKEEMEILVTKNAALVQRNSALEDQMAYMENMVTEMKHKFEQSESERESLRQRLVDLKRLVD